MVIPADLRACTWTGGGGGGFRPHGKIVKHSIGTIKGLSAIEHMAATTWQSQNVIAARIFVGFNVGRKPRWKLDDLIPLVRDFRLRQHEDPTASFLAQRGIYKHRDSHKGLIVEEDGAQVIIIAPRGMSFTLFKKQMIALGTHIARKFDQESVVVEIQKNGIIQVTMGVDQK